MEFVSRFFRIPEQSCFLFGPRGTGKSTWLRHRLPAARFLDLLDPPLHRSLSARPERLRELLAGSPQQRTVVIDEIQRIPELLTVVHAILEEPSPPRFILTGSSARKLRRGGVDLLGGRAVHRTLHPFMAAELPAFDLARALQIGLVPLVAGASDPAATLDGYASLHLDQEVRAEGLTRNVGSFTRFLEAVSFSHAAQLNVSAVARGMRGRAQGGRRLRRHSRGPAAGLPAAGLSQARQACDGGPRQAVPVRCGRVSLPAAQRPLDRAGDIDGQALEGLVAQHLRAWVAYSRRDAEIFFWRTRAGTEVDFVVYGEPGLQAFEVQNASRVHASDLRPLRTFREDYPEADAALLYRGRERLRIDGIWCLPVEDVLRRMVPDQGLLGWL